MLINREKLFYELFEKYGERLQRLNFEGESQFLVFGVEEQSIDEGDENFVWFNNSNTDNALLIGSDCIAKLAQVRRYWDKMTIALLLLSLSAVSALVVYLVIEIGLLIIAGVPFAVFILIIMSIIINSLIEQFKYESYRCWMQSYGKSININNDIATFINELLKVEKSNNNDDKAEKFKFKLYALLTVVIAVAVSFSFFALGYEQFSKPVSKLYDNFISYLFQ